MEPISGRRPPDAAPTSDWHQSILRTVSEITPFIQGLLARMAAAGFTEKDQFSVRLALEEALVNAVKHGNGADPAKKVTVASQVTPEQLTTRIEDEGPGFRPDLVPDPLAPENLERPGGRGVFLMRHYMTTVSFNERGNCVTLCKRRCP